jgi:hypothetical protein
VSVKFVNPETGIDLRSTEFARRVLASASRKYPELQQEILGAPDWRWWYLKLYASLAQKEGLSKEATTEIASSALTEFHNCLFTDDGQKLQEAIFESFDSDLVETVTISGAGQAVPITISGHRGSLEETALRWVESGLAEPGLVESYRFLDLNTQLDLSENLLFAVAGAAEFAPTEDFLKWGGLVAVVARPNPEKWANLINTARQTGGTMLVPIRKSQLTKPVTELSDLEIAEIAGLDILDHYREISSWMKLLSARARNRFVLGLYAYSPKIDHIRVQAVQEMLSDVAMKKIPPEKLALSWLATPTDSAPGPASIGEEVIEKFSSRKPVRVLRDSLLGLVNAARPARPIFFQAENGSKLSIIDASVQQQGPSYSFSKRTQRYRAYLAHYAGVKVSYAISPPARTNSVLRHKILRASYRGAPLFGVMPFEVAEAKSAIAAVLVRDLHDKTSFQDKDTTVELHTFSAIHGGLWRLIYRSKSVWLAATILGIGALFRKGY